MCFLRDESAASALATLEAARPHLDRITGVGLDSAEAGHPPSKFREVYEAAAALGLRRVAHAGEEGPPEYITEALDVLGVERVDHGLRCVEDPALVRRLEAASGHAVPARRSHAALAIRRSLGKVRCWCTSLSGNHATSMASCSSAP